MVETFEWYPAKDIRFLRPHIIFLLKHLLELREGNYPPDPGVSGYTEAPGGIKTTSARGASFEMACQLAAEVDSRLKATGLDGYLVEEKYIDEKSEQDISDERHIALEEVFRRLRTAINYMSGWRRRQYSYADFKRHRRRKVKV